MRTAIPTGITLRCGSCGQPVKMIRRSGHMPVWAHKITLQELGEICYAIDIPLNHHAVPKGMELSGL